MDTTALNRTIARSHEDKHVANVEAECCTEKQHDKLPIHRYQLSKEIMFMISAFLVLFASGGLVLG